MTNPICPSCPHKRNQHGSDGCEAEVMADGWKYFCGCDNNDCEISDTGTYLSTDSDEYDAAVRRKYAR